MRHRVLFALPFALLVLLIIGCPNPAAGPNSTDDSAGVKRLKLEAYGPTDGTYETGILGPGAQYQIWMPPRVAWNGCLVMYAHGYVNPLQDVALPTDAQAMLPLLLSNGYAVAQSSYSQNGWAVKDGAIRTRQLRGYFSDAYGAPSKVYLVGASEGAMISVMLAEKNPELFAGALCIGGPLGGAEMEVQYIYNLRILFDYFFGDELDALVLAGMPDAVALRASLGDGPLDAHPTGDLPEDGAAFASRFLPLITALFGAPPFPEALSMATTTVDGKPMFNWSEAMLASGGYLPELAITIGGGLWYNVYGTEDMLSRTHGHVPVDNTDSVYVDGTTGAVLSVERLTSTPDAVNYLDHWYQPTGKLRIPVVILHTARDPIVPVAHVQAYQDLVDAQGRTDMLTVMPIIDAFGHCQILAPPQYDPTDPASVAAFAGQVLAAFDALLEATGMPDLILPPGP